MIRDLITGFFVGEEFEWNLSLNPQQVTSIISGLGSGRIFDAIFAQTIQVSIDQNKFGLYRGGIAKIPMSGNSFVHSLHGRIAATPTGSKVTARFRLPTFVFAFLVVWLSGALGISTVIFLGSIYKICKSPTSDSFFGLAFSIGFPAIGLFGLASFRKLARPNEEEVKRAITEALAPYFVRE